MQLEKWKRLFKFKLHELWGGFNPTNSLRTTLYLWFLVISLVPLLIFAIYSSRQLENIITQELIARIQSHFLGIQTELQNLEKSLLNGVQRHREDRSLRNYLSSQNTSKLRTATQLIIREYIADRISFYNTEGKALLHVEANSPTFSQEQLSPNILHDIKDNKTVLTKKSYPQKGIGYSAYSFIQHEGEHIGIIEEIVFLDKNYANATYKSTDLDIVILDHDNHVLAQNDRNNLPALNFSKGISVKTINVNNPHLQAQGINVAQEFKINDHVFLALTQEITNGNKGISGKISLLVSKNIYYEAASRIQKNIVVFVLLLIFTLLITVIFASYSIVNPIKILVEATSQLKTGKFKTISKKATHELGVLTDSFNEMAQSITHMKKELENKVNQLEVINKELKTTQARLVHSAKMVSLGKLVAGVAHELNNPIAAIYSNMQHLEEYIKDIHSLMKEYDEKSKKLPPEEAKKMKQLWREKDIDFVLEDAQKIIDSAIDGAERTKKIVLGLRNFSRLDEAEKKTVDIHEGIESTLQLLHNEIKNRITVHKNYGELFPLTCYPSELNQVFMNLLSNASQAISNKGDITITTKQDGDNIIIDIQDTGCGIDEKYMDNIFDPFFTTKEVGKGTGLGLSISYNIVKKHKGDITVKSEKGKGTTFTITLPLSRKDRQAINSK